MKQKNLVIIGLWVIGLFFSSVSQAALDGVAAIVNDEIITMKEVREHAAMQARSGQKTSLKNALEELVDTSLEYQLAKQNKFTVDDATVTSIIQDIAQRNHLSLDVLYQHVALEGMDKKTYREMIRKQVTIARFLQQQLGGSIQISRDEVNAAMNQMKKVNKDSFNAPPALYQVVHFVLPLDANAGTEEEQSLKQQAMQMRQLLLKKPSSTLIKEKFPQAELGDLGWRAISEMPEIFAQQVKNMKVGAVSQPLRTPRGIQLIQLVAKKEANQGTANAAPNLDVAKRMVYERKLHEAIVPMLKEARKQAYVQILMK